MMRFCSSQNCNANETGSQRTCDIAYVKQLVAKDTEFLFLDLRGCQDLCVRGRELLFIALRNEGRKVESPY